LFWLHSLGLFHEVTLHPWGQKDKEQEEQLCVEKT
jgi:hypothetical protein